MGCNHDCASCSSNCGGENDLHEKLNDFSTVRHVIGVVSGKGGVGKSLVTSMLAVESNRRGFNTAILDADVTGPSIPKSFGITKKAVGNELGKLLMQANLVLQGYRHCGFGWKDEINQPCQGCVFIDKVSQLMPKDKT